MKFGLLFPFFSAVLLFFPTQGLLELLGPDARDCQPRWQLSGTLRTHCFPSVLTLHLTKKMPNWLQECQVLLCGPLRRVSMLSLLRTTDELILATSSSPFLLGKRPRPRISRSRARRLRQIPLTLTTVSAKNKLAVRRGLVCSHIFADSHCRVMAAD